MTYEIIEVPDSVSTQLEQLGTKAKFWFYDRDGVRTMFKEGRPGTGENWAEKVACELCALLGIPHAHYELGCWSGKDGVVSKTIVPDDGRLILGNELLGRLDTGYQHDQVFRASQHTVKRAFGAIERSGAAPPVGACVHEGNDSAVAVFLSYLMLDVLVSNQDRHHENWGLIVADRKLSLAPTFDHASSLGRNETEATMQDRLNTRDVGRSVGAYVERARSAFYATSSSKKPLTTLEAFLAASQLHKDATCAWRAKLSSLDMHDVEGVFSEIPDSMISPIATDFALAIIAENRKRILSAL